MREAQRNAEGGGLGDKGNPGARPLGGRPEDPQTEEESEDVQGVGW